MVETVSTYLGFGVGSVCFQRTQIMANRPVHYAPTAAIIGPLIDHYMDKIDEWSNTATGLTYEYIKQT
jgi:hypothetical protein